MGVSTNAVLGYGMAWEEEWSPEGEGLEGDERFLVETALEPLGVELDWHCSERCQMPALFVRGTTTTAYRGNVVEVSTREPGADWRARLERARDAIRKVSPSFAELGEPKVGWLLVSQWG